MAIVLDQRAPSWMHDLRKASKGARFGGFAEVYPLNSFQVLKLTTCQATRELFNALLTEKSVPNGLPVVFKSYGVCGVDSDLDSEPVEAWVIERLFEPDDEHAQRMARVYGVPVASRKRYPQLTAYTRPSPTRVSDLVRASNQVRLRQMHKGSQPASSIFLEMASLMDETLQPAFRKLASLSQRHPGWKADLEVSGNVLVDMRGTVTLADPVYHLSTSRHKTKEKVIPVRVPVRLKGDKVTTLPMCLPFRTAREEKAKRSALLEAGLSPGSALQANGREHLEFMSQGPATLSASSFAEVSLRLRLNDYEELMSDLF